MTTGANGASATMPLTRKSRGPRALRSKFEEEIESGRRQRRRVAHAQGANAGVVPVDVGFFALAAVSVRVARDVGGMMVIRRARREGFRVQPAQRANAHRTLFTPVLKF